MEGLNVGRLSVLETCLYVDDLAAAERFYTDVLGFEKLSAVQGRHVFFHSGEGVLLLFNPEASLVPQDLPPHGTRGPGHCCFRLEESDYGRWKARLESHGVVVVAEHTWSPGIKSLYFHDPAGNLLELAPARIWR